jgi:hypothetical protein
MLLKVAFDDPANGWIGLTIEDGDKEFAIIASYTPGNSLADLTTLLQGLMEYEGQRPVTWHEEPSECVMVFSREAQVTRLEIYRYPDRRRGVSEGEKLCDISGTYEEICIPFWRALKDLEGRYEAAAFEAAWRRRFPSEELAKLTEAIRNKRYPSPSDVSY